MAAGPLFNQFLIWTSISASLAYSVNLINEPSTKVPGCAQDCLKDFISVNYPQSLCGSSPSLECLCTNSNAGGFTIGEGAAICIGGALETRICDETEASSKNVEDAYSMCSQVSSALPNTHVTLSATVIRRPTGTGSIIISTPDGALFPSSTTTHKSSVTSSTSTIPSSTRTSTSQPSTLQTSTTSRTSSSSTSSLSSSSTSTSSATTTTTRAQPTTPVSQPTETSQPVSSTTLGTTQIVGITAGVVGGVVLLTLAAIFLARKLRKKNYPDLYDESFSTDFKKDSPGQSRMTQIFHISPPLFRFSRPALERQPSPPTASNNEGRDPTIGLAISRPRSDIAPRRLPEVPLERKRSKLLPAKPTLTLEIPPPATTKNGPSSNPPPTTDRASTMTNMTAFADLDTEAAEGGQIWRPPPTDPQSARSLYIADKRGNWVLWNDNRRSELSQVAQVAELDTYTPLTKSPIERREEEIAAAMMAQADCSSSSNINNNAAMTTTNFPQKPMPAFLLTDPNNPSTMSMSRSSSLYSQASAVRAAVTTTTRPPPPPARRSSSSSRKGAYKANSAGVRRSDSKDSHASMTTIINDESSSEGEDLDDGDDDDDRENQNARLEDDIARLSQFPPQLSPVVESPSPISRAFRLRSDGIGAGGAGGGVRYPKIPGRLDGATIRMVPPPKRPTFSNSPSGQPPGFSHSPPGQPSPTLGTVLPVATGSPSAYPPPLRPKRPPYRGPGPGPTPTPAPVQSSGSGFSPVPPPPPPPEPMFPQQQQERYQQLLQRQLQRQIQIQQQQQEPPQRPQRPQPQPHQQQHIRQVPRTPTPPQQEQQQQYQRYQQQQPPPQQWRPPQPRRQQRQPPQPRPQPSPPFPSPPQLDTSQIQIPEVQGQRRDSPSHIASQFNNNNNNNNNNTMASVSPMSKNMSMVSTAKTASTASASSSLLVKRLGNDRAAALALDPKGKQQQRAAPWRRQGGGDDGLLSPDAAFASPRGPRPMPGSELGPGTGGTLPMTPTWQPKLTPTRRGSALFLNVN